MAASDEAGGSGLRLRRLLTAPVGLVVSGAALWVALRGVNLGSAAHQLQHAAPGPLLLILGVIAVQLSLRTLRWRALLAIAHPAELIRLATLLPILLIGYLGNAVLPARLGEPIRAFLAARAEHLDTGVVFGTVVLERVLDTASLAVLAFGAALVLGAPAWLTQASALAALAGVVVVAAVLAGGLGLLARALARLEGRLPPRAIAGGLRFVRFVAAGADAAQERPAAALALGISGACWLLDATTFWLVGQSLGIALAPTVALLIAAVTVLGTALPSAPGYLGTFELAAAGTATALGVPASAAFSLAVLAHVMMVAPSALGGAVALSASGMGLASLSSGARTVRQEQAVVLE
jgi:uncharacterized protein (TIRG00374 family)